MYAVLFVFNQAFCSMQTLISLNAHLTFFKIVSPLDSSLLLEPAEIFNGFISSVCPPVLPLIFSLVTVHVCLLFFVSFLLLLYRRLKCSLFSG